MDRRSLFSKALLSLFSITSLSLLFNRSNASEKEDVIPPLSDKFKSDPLNYEFASKAKHVKSIKDAIDNSQFQYSISVLKNGGVNDRFFDNTELIQKIINSMDKGIITIENGCLWREKSILLKNDVQLIDFSGFNSESDQWGGQIKFILKTSEPEKKNANEIVIKSNHHPALVVDNTGGGIASRSSVVFRYEGSTRWALGQGISDSDQDFRIAGGKWSPLAGRFYISWNGDSMSWNAPLLDDVNYHFGCRSWSGNIIARYSARKYYGTEFQFHTNVGRNTYVQCQRVCYNSDGTIDFYQLGNKTLSIGVGGELFSNRKKIIHQTSLCFLNEFDSNVTHTNKGGEKTVVFILPKAQEGLVYTFLVVNSFGIIVKLKKGEIFRATLNKVKLQSKAIGSSVMIICVEDGIWDILSQYGDWEGLHYNSM
ncbi:hypothetical protein [Serratia fonticola]|uniref:hypothetical protein n=1 Tax=Serratia fonticola TaxID=47917 RepID=UPI0016479679|nr:hypothetical protein [Serratia fonticola]MBC3229586.1 hypothetical protein [Serratia fonticola]